MTIQLVNLGTYANDNTGDDLRTAFNKVNANFTELDTIVAVNGANLGTGTGVFASKVDDPGLGNLLNFRSIAVGSNLTLSLANNTITVNTQGTITANLTGNVTGNVSGNAGTVTNGIYTTSSINALADVDTVTIAPTSGQALAWNGTTWTPQTIAAGVTRIIAGTNVTISPTNGLGQVTINSSGISDVFDLGEFQQTYENPISYLLDQVGVDFGSFTSPSAFTIDGGTF